MRKFYFLFVAAIMGLTSCSKNNDDDGNNQNQNQNCINKDIFFAAEGNWNFVGFKEGNGSYIPYYRCSTSSSTDKIEYIKIDYIESNNTAILHYFRTDFKCGIITETPRWKTEFSTGINSSICRGYFLYGGTGHNYWFLKGPLYNGDGGCPNCGTQYFTEISPMASLTIEEVTATKLQLKIEGDGTWFVYFEKRK